MLLSRRCVERYDGDFRTPLCQLHLSSLMPMKVRLVVGKGSEVPVWFWVSLTHVFQIHSKEGHAGVVQATAGLITGVGKAANRINATVVEASWLVI